MTAHPAIGTRAAAATSMTMPIRAVRRPRRMLRGGGIIVLRATTTMPDTRGMGVVALLGTMPVGTAVEAGGEGSMAGKG
jgi:hypothetical protein